MFELVVVPELEPRTKPKALNYAMPLVHGEYIVIYDADDRPEPGQLRQRSTPSARVLPILPRCRRGLASTTRSTLSSDGSSPWNIARCSTGLLPALDRLGLPIPLGGTSNHFRASALKWLMAWDPFN